MTTKHQALSVIHQISLEHTKVLIALLLATSINEQRQTIDQYTVTDALINTQLQTQSNSPRKLNSKSCTYMMFRIVCSLFAIESKHRVKDVTNARDEGRCLAKSPAQSIELWQRYHSKLVIKPALTRCRQHSPQFISFRLPAGVNFFHSVVVRSWNLRCLEMSLLDLTNWTKSV